MTDDRRRLVMPPELPPKSAVTVQQIDTDTWIVKRHTENKAFKVVLIPIIERLADDPEWEATEARMTAHNNRRVPPFEE